MRKLKQIPFRYWLTFPFKDNDIIISTFYNQFFNIYFDVLNVDIYFFFFFFHF